METLLGNMMLNQTQPISTFRSPRRDLVDFVPVTFQLVEGGEGGRVVVRGEFAKCGIPTENKRVYPGKVWEQEIKRLNKSLKERQVFGELDHPNDGRTMLRRVSHVITSLTVRDGIVEGTAEILPTEPGKTLLALLKANCKVGVSSRGSGSTSRSEEGHDVVQEDYRLHTFDFVADPADMDAIPEIVSESIQPGNRRHLFEGVEIEADNREEESSRLLVLREAERRAEAEAVRASMRDAMTEHVLAVFAAQKEDLRDQIRGELLSDPAVASAKRLLDEVKSILVPHLLPEDAMAPLREKDTLLQQAQRVIAERDLTLSKLEKENQQLSEMARIVGYKLYVEQSLSGQVAVEDARKNIGDVTQFSSAVALKARVQEVLDALQTRSQEASQKEISALESLKTSHAALTENLRGKLSELTERNKYLSEALDKAMEATDLLRIEQKGLIEHSEALEKDRVVRDYIEEQLVNHPRSADLRAKLQVARPATKEAAKRLIEDANRVPRRDSFDVEAVRAGVRSRLGGGFSSTPLDEETAPSTRSRPQVDSVLEEETGISINEFNKLTGNRGR